MVTRISHSNNCNTSELVTKFFKTLEKEGFTVNKKKTKCFYNYIGNKVYKVKTFKYLGYKLRANGKPFNKIDMEKDLLTYTKKLRFIAKKNLLKAY